MKVPLPRRSKNLSNYTPDAPSGCWNASQRCRIITSLILICCLTCLQGALLGTAFTYQGRLTEDGRAANNLYQMRFVLFDAATNGNQVGMPVTHALVPVTNGAFSVELDFGATAFDGAARWLEIAVSVYGSDVPPLTLAPRQPIGGTPYASYARAAGTAAVVTGNIPATQLMGTIAPAHIAPGTITSSMLADGSVGSNQLAGDIHVPRLNKFVYIPQAGHITNVFKTLSNDTTYVLAPGIHEISAFRYFSDNHAPNAHLQFVGKSNVTIRGAGWNSIIFAATIGNLFHYAHSFNITLEDLKIEGTRGPYDTRSLFGAVNLMGTNAHLTFRNVWFKNHADHGIVSFSSVLYPKNSTYVTVENCLFEDIGSTNWPVDYASADGTAVNVVGANMRIRNCVFRRCRLGIEFEGTATATIRNVLIEGNLFVDGLMQQIMQYPTTPNGTYEDVLIRDNTIVYDRASALGGSAVGIMLTSIRRGQILNNVFRNCETSIFFNAHTMNLDAWTIAGNHIIHNRDHTAMIIGAGTGFMVDAFTITGNYFTDCNWWAMALVGARRCRVADNVFNAVGAVQGSPIYLQDGTGGSTCASNLISRNHILGIAGASAPAIHIASGSQNRFEQNEIWHFTAASPWIDSGTASEFRNNWIGTNLAVRSSIYQGPSAVQSLAANATVTLNALVIQVAGNGGSITLNSNTSIPDGLWDGQTLRVIGTSTNAVTFPDNSNVQLAVGTSKTVGHRDILDLIWNANEADWLQTGFTDN